jgi:IS1 family transposase
LHAQLPGATKVVLLRRLDAEADGVCSLVRKQVNKQWLWLAMDTSTRQIPAFHVGDRRRKSAEHLRAKIPVAYREQATC